MAGYIRDKGFAFIKAPDPYKQGFLLRYKLGDNEILSETAAPSSLSGLRQTLSVL